jgi:copper(I)-binding protein
MSRLIRRRAALQAGLALGSGLLLRPAQACEYFGTTLRVTHPWTRATAVGADTAVLCMRLDEVTQPDRLIGVQTPVATGAVMGGLRAGSAVDLLIPAGQETLLSETGIHVRLTGLKFPLEIARTYPLQLVFEKGGVIEATLNVDYGRFL